MKNYNEFLLYENILNRKIEQLLKNECSYEVKGINLELLIPNFIGLNP